MTQAELMHQKWYIPKGELDEKRSLGLPVHVYAGVCLVATFFSADAASWAVEQHNAQINAEDGA